MNKPAASTIQRSFVDALAGDDELGVVVRSHLHIEAKLNEYIETNVPDPGALPSLRYYQKVEMACALGLPSANAPALKALGEIRNLFAHDPDAGISPQSVAKLRKALSEIARSAADSVCESLIASGIELGGGNLDSADPRGQFAIIAIALRSMLQASIDEARRRLDTPQRRMQCALDALSTMYPKNRP